MFPRDDEKPARVLERAEHIEQLSVAIQIWVVAALGHRQGGMNPDSAVQSDTGIKRQALRSEDNRSLANSGLQAPVL